MTKKCDQSPPGPSQAPPPDLVPREGPGATPFVFDETRLLPENFIAFLHQAERWGMAQGRFTSEANPWAMFSLLVFYACGLSQGKTELSHIAVRSDTYDYLCDAALALWQSGSYLPDPSAFPYPLERVIDAKRSEREPRERGKA